LIELLLIVDDTGAPWFIASEVCAILALDDVSKACSRLEEDEKQLISNKDAISLLIPTFHSELKTLMIVAHGALDTTQET